MIRKFILCILSVFITSCEDDEINTIRLSNIGSDLDIVKIFVPVEAHNIPLGKTQTNGLTSYQLGTISNPIYGSTNATILTQLQLSVESPTFGKYSQSTEDSSTDDDNDNTINEQETITKVTLNIPFFSELKRDESLNIETDGDKSVYELDSIFGNIDAQFKIKIEENTYYLGNLDPEDISKQRIYYSNDNFSDNKGELIADEIYQIDSSETLIYAEDDPDTDDNESTEITSRIAPRINIPLDNTFFQQKIIDKEGSKELENNLNFIDYLRGIIISTDNFSAPVMMLLDFNNSYIEIEYTYKELSTEDDELQDKTATFRLNMGGNIINLLDYTKTSNYPTVDPDANAERIYLNGTQFVTEIDLSQNQELFDKLKVEKNLINEANLTFYIDENNTNANIPYRIYIFDLDNNGTPFIDYTRDFISNSSFVPPLPVYGGILTKEDDKSYYKIRITEYINNIIRQDNDISRIGVMITTNILDSSTIESHRIDNQQALRIPRSAVINPLGVVLYGSNTKVEEDKRLQLEVYYTKSKDE